MVECPPRHDVKGFSITEFNSAREPIALGITVLPVTKEEAAGPWDHPNITISETYIWSLAKLFEEHDNSPTASIKAYTSTGADGHRRVHPSIVSDDSGQLWTVFGTAYHASKVKPIASLAAFIGMKGTREGDPTRGLGRGITADDLRSEHGEESGYPSLSVRWSDEGKKLEGEKSILVKVALDHLLAVLMEHESEMSTTFMPELMPFMEDPKTLTDPYATREGPAE